jgi:predicted alpha-1,6-mannanase (GH76 family)
MYTLNYPARLVLLMLFAFSACKPEKEASVEIEKKTINWGARADSATHSFIDHFWNSPKKYFNYDNIGNTEFHYWPQAHALDVVIDAYLRTQDAQYVTYMNQWHEGVPVMNGGNFINDFYDDMEWNGLAMLRAYEVTGNEQFKAGVDQVWEDIKLGWNEEQGGGIAWQKKQLYYKNTPANAPACILAARLYQKFNLEEDKEWTIKIYNWLKPNLFVAETGFVYDGVNRQNDGKKDDWQFTYNQGLFIGASLELYKITQDKSYLDNAIKAANYAINSNVTNRILKDEGKGDGGLFKGVFVRYFAQLILHPDLPTETRKRYINFLTYNAETLWTKGTDKSKILFGSYWATPPVNETDLTIQTSGAILLEAMALLEKEGMVSEEE